MTITKFYVIALLSSFLFISCGEDDNDPQIPSDDAVDVEAYENGYLVAHEGAFNGGFGTVSFIDGPLTTSENGIYQFVNNDNLGGIVQSVAFTEDLAFIVSNLSNKITIVDRFTFEEVAKVESGLSNPRYIAIAGDKAFVTNWGDGSIATDDYLAIIDLSSYTITGTIPVSEGPEQIVYNGTSLYVTHKGGFAVNNLVSVINPNSELLESTIVVGDAPDDLEIDIEGNLWVLCEGTQSFQGEETGGRIVKINTETNAIIFTSIFATADHPNYMDLEGEAVFYYLNGAVMKAGLNDNLAEEMLPILEGLSFYGMTVTPNGQLLGCNAGDFNSSGTIEVYDLTDNALLNTIEVGLVPAKVYANF